MRKHFGGLAMAMVTFCMLAALSPQAADNYTVDSVHSGVTFKVKHFDLAWIPGRFNDFSGNFTIDTADPSKSAFNMTINATSIDTNNPQRNDHLRSPDFFNVKQFPTITFKSTAVKAMPEKGGYQV